MTEILMREELLDTHDVPTLNTVVESGDETIIQTSRLGREVIRELRAIGTQANPHIHVGENPSEFPSQLSPPAETPALSLAAFDETQFDHTEIVNSSDLDDLQNGFERRIESAIQTVVERRLAELREQLCHDMRDVVLQALKQT